MLLELGVERPPVWLSMEVHERQVYASFVFHTFKPDFIFSKKIKDLMTMTNLLISNQFPRVHAL